LFDLLGKENIFDGIEDALEAARLLPAVAK
jgi:hypothetical protein